MTDLVSESRERFEGLMTEGGERGASPPCQCINAAGFVLATPRSMSSSVLIRAHSCDHWCVRIGRSPGESFEPTDQPERDFELKFKIGGRRLTRTRKARSENNLSRLGFAQELTEGTEDGIFLVSESRERFEGLMIKATCAESRPYQRINPARFCS